MQTISSRVVVCLFLTMSDSNYMQQKDFYLALNTYIA